MKHSSPHEFAPTAQILDLTAEEYFHLLHPEGSRGKAAVLCKLGPDDVQTHTYAAAPLIAQMPHFVDRTSFLTLNRFWYGRKLKSLAALNALYVDLDYFHMPQWKGKSPAEVQSAFAAHLLISGMPQPSVFLQTGRGLAAIWLIEPIPVSALRRWKGAMGALIDFTVAFGADKACKDATRVFRIPGTLNEKSQKEVRVSGGTVERYRFDDLTEKIYRAAGRPTRAELQERKKRKSKKRRASAKMPRGMTQAERFRLIHDDLAVFRDAHGSLIPTGLRNTWLHFYATCLTHLPEVRDLEAEILRAAQSATPGLERSEVTAIIRQATEKAKLRTSATSWSEGRYHYRGATMAERLGITPDLARALGLKQVIPEQERRRRKADAERQRRASNGAMSRDEYLAANNASRTKPWAALGIGRTKYYELKRVGMLPEPVAAVSRTGPCPLQGQSPPAWPQPGGRMATTAPPQTHLEPAEQPRGQGEDTDLSARQQSDARRKEKAAEMLSVSITPVPVRA